MTCAAKQLLSKLSYGFIVSLKAYKTIWMEVFGELLHVYAKHLSTNSCA